MANKSPAQSGSVPLVAVQGQVSLTEAFFEHLDKTLTVIVKAAAHDCFKEMNRGSAAVDRQRVEPTADPAKKGNCPRWSVFELLEWVMAGGPRRGEWIKQHG